MPEAETKVEETEEEETEATEEEATETEAAAGDETKPAGDGKDTATEEVDPGGKEEVVEEDGDALTAELLEQAASHGYDEAAARAFGTADNLQTALVGLDTKLAEMGRKAADKDEDEPTPAPRPRTIPKRSEKPVEEKVDEFKVELSEDVDPEIAKSLNKIVGHLNAKVAGLEGKLADTEQYVLEQESRTFRTKMDGIFTALDDQWEETFGKGTGDSLGLNSPQLKNRLTVLDTCSALARGMEMTGQKVPSDKALMDRAVQADFGKQQKAIDRKALAGAAKKRSRQISSRPTSRRGKLSGRDAAIAKSKKYDTEHGVED